MNKEEIKKLITKKEFIDGNPSTSIEVVDIDKLAELLEKILK